MELLFNLKLFMFIFYLWLLSSIVILLGASIVETTKECTVRQYKVIDVCLEGVKNSGMVMLLWGALFVLLMVSSFSI